MDIVGVSRARTSGSLVTKAGRKQYRGRKRHWYVYYYDDEGKFRKRQISPLEVPYYGSLIRRRKSFKCGTCGLKFRSMTSRCPNCGIESGVRLDGSEKATQAGSHGLETTPLIRTGVTRPMPGLELLGNLESD
jgi:hypothetical protein